MIRFLRRPENHLKRFVSLILILGCWMSVLITPVYSTGGSPARRVKTSEPKASKLNSATAPTPSTSQQTQADRAAQDRARESYGSLPISFVANQGQTDSEVKFLTRGSGYSLYLTPRETVLVLSRRSREQAASPKSDSLPAADKPLKRTVIRMKLEGANPQTNLVGLDELPGKTNYFIGNDPEKWLTGVTSYRRIMNEAVYSGVDMLYHGNQRQLEYDFIVAPQADPGVIRLKFSGAQSLRIHKDGDLILKTADGGELRQRAPVIYQEGDRGREHINGRFILTGKREVGFDVGEYDRSRPLVIDPVLVYSTYLGGGSEDQGNGIAVDVSGNAYLTGFTSSLDFPLANPFQSSTTGSWCVFVSKLNPTGTALLYSTYIGGTTQGGYAKANGIAVDTSGNVYITGIAYSTNFPTVNPIQANLHGRGDAFVAKLNTTGTALIYSTYLGGSEDDYSTPDSGKGIAVDSSGNAYIAGETGAPDFPVANPLQATNQGGNYHVDAFATKINAAGTAFLYSTYLGGSSDDTANAIAVDSSGSAYITGTTTSTNFPIANALQGNVSGGDAFVAKLSTTGTALVYSTYLGGSGSEEGKGIAVDATGNAYVTGTVASNNFPTTAGSYRSTYAGGTDAFVSKLSSTGTSLVYSTYLGSSSYDASAAIAVDLAGSAYVVGQTNSLNFPMTSGSITGKPLSSDVFLTKFNTTGTALIYSTLLGSNISNQDFGTSIALDSAANAYITGSTGATDFPITQSAFQPTHTLSGGSSFDSFVTKIADIGSYSISGRLTDNLGAGVAANKVVVSGSLAYTTQTDNSGNYWLGGLPANGNYTITPMADRYAFTPLNQTFNNLIASQTFNFTGTLKTYTIGGHVTNTSGAALSDVTVDLSGSQSGTMQTDLSGNYSFSVNAGATYTVTPWMDGLTFTPPNLTFSNLAANQTGNFSAAFSINGQILNSVGSGLSYATINLTGSQTITITADVSGNYSFDNLQPQGNYTVTPVATGYSFSPSSTSFSNLSSSRTANFTGTSYSIAGQITGTISGLPVNGVSMNLSGSATGAVSTDQNGNYIFPNVVPGGTYTITPNRGGYVFTPTSQTLTSLSANQTINFTGTTLVVTVRAREYSGYPLYSTPINVTGTQNFSGLTDAQGNFSFNVSPGGTYTVTPAHNFFAVNPSSRTVANISSDQTMIFIVPQNFISGRITDPEGNGLINIPVNFTGSQSGTVKTDLQGNYQINVALGGNYTVTPNEYGYVFLPVSQSFTGLSTNQVANFTAAYENTILGRVRNANRIGLADVTVMLTGTHTLTTQTDAGGTYSFHNLVVGGNYWVMPSSTDYTFSPASKSCSEGCWPTADFIALATGVVPLNPVADAHVTAANPTTNYGDANALIVQNSSVPGSNSETYVTFDIEGIAGNIANARLRLFGALSDTSGTNLFTSVYALTNPNWIETGASGITWATKPVSSSSAISSVTVADNVSRWYEIDVSSFVIAERSAGRNVFTLVLKTPGLAVPATVFNSREASANKPELVVTTAPTIATLSPTSGPLSTTVALTGNSFGATQGLSTLTFNGVAATATTWSDKSITVSVPPGAGTGPVIVTVNNVPSNSLTFTVTNTGTVGGKITRSSDGTAINGAKVDVLQGGALIATATTPSSGLYSIGSLLAGTYDLRVSATGFGTVVQSGNPVVSGNTTTVNVVLSSAGTIAGKVTGPGAVAISGATVRVTQGATVIGNATTNATGDYSVGSLGAGTYTLEASATGYQTKSQTGVIVTSGATTTVNLSLNSATATYHLHKEASTTAGLFQLKTTGPDGTSLAVQSADLKSQAIGEKLIKALDTQAGVPNASGTILAGSAVTFTLWMKKTAALGTMFPRTKVFLNSATGPSLCSVTGTSALSTTLTKYSLTCNTASNVTVTTADRFYLWVGVNLTVGASSATFKGEVDIEGTLNGNYDSLIAVPVPVATPTIASLSPSSGPVGTLVTITGSNFGAAQGTSTVTFNGVQASPTSWNNSTVVASVPTGALTGSVIVIVNGLPANAMTFTVTGPGTMSGTITRTSDGAPISGATIEVLKYNVVKASATSAANGSYTINGLLAGTYDLRVSASGFGTAVRVGNAVASGGTTTVNVGLTSTGTVAGKVTNSAGTSISSATVRIYQGTTTVSTATTNGTGDYSVATLAAGNYTVEASAAGYQTYSQTGIVVNAGATTTLNLSLNATSATYHLHTEASSTSGLFQLKTAGPDATNLALTSSELNGQPTGERIIKAFDTQTGVPNSSGLIPSGSTITFTLWMKKTANLGTMFPRIKLFLNNSTGTLLCTVTGTTALTTTLTKYTLTGTTASNIVVSPSDRFYLWVGINLTVGSSSGTFKGELDIEGVLNGNFDSLITMPLPLAVPAIATITPGIGRVGDTFTVAGVNFGASQGTSTLTVNGVTITALSWNNTNIVATVPSGAATGPAIVTVSGLASNGFTFFVDMSPSITSLSPTWGPVGTSVTVSGINFGATQGTSTIRFNGVLASPTNWNANSIVVPVPSGVVTGPVLVTVAGADSNGVVFKVSSTSPPPDPSGVTDTNGAVNLKVYTTLEPSP